MNKEHILSEIRRTAAANRGVPLGVARFSQETGIKNSDWQGKIWVRWGDALREAGFEPNQLQGAYSDEFLMEKFISLMRELGHYPVTIEVEMKARRDNSFPWDTTLVNRFGLKQQRAAKILEYCRSRAGYEDVSALCEPIAARVAEEEAEQPDDDDAPTTKEGDVYICLMQVGREKRYRIGHSVLAERRRDQVGPTLPEKYELIWKIHTDDAYGIERYWLRRFAAKCTNGDWFNLSLADVRAFKRRKSFM
jgi:hypothetical protein